VTLRRSQVTQFVTSWWGDSGTFASTLQRSPLEDRDAANAAAAEAAAAEATTSTPNVSPIRNSRHAAETAPQNQRVAYVAGSADDADEAVCLTKGRTRLATLLSSQVRLATERRNARLQLRADEV
jgi:hypothetical protein